MTNANMKFVVVEVLFPDQIELSDAKLEEGEHIVKRIVELPKLSDELAGESFSEPFCQLSVLNIYCNSEHERKVRT